MLDRLSAGVCVLSVASRPHWRGLRRFFRALSEQREGAGRQRTTPSEPRADRGSDSTFQMADIARRILARGSTSPPVCKTADCFLFSLFLSLCPLPCLLPPSAPASFLQIPNIKTQISTRRWAAGLIPQFLSCVFIISIFTLFLSIPLLPPFFPFFVTLPLTSLPLLLTPSLSAKKKSSLHMVMIILHSLIFCSTENIAHYPALLLPSFSISWSVRLCGKLFAPIFAALPLTTQQKCADHRPQPP